MLHPSTLCYTKAAESFTLRRESADCGLTLSLPHMDDKLYPVSMATVSATLRGW